MTGGGGGGVVPVSSRAQQPGRGGRRGHRQKAAWLPLDVIAAIAARSDPATLVRCAATCRDARRRIAEDPSLLGRLQLRDTGRFFFPLLRGHLVGITTYTWPSAEKKTDVYMVDTTGAADATRLVKTFAGADGRTVKKDVVPVDSRGGLILIRKQGQLLVCNPATRRSLVLPSEPAFPGPVWSSTGVVLVLLVSNRHDEGDDSAAAVGRPFQVLKAKLESSHCRPYCRLLMHTFSSEHGAWSPLTEIPTPDIVSGIDYQRPLVVGDFVHWLCMTNSGNYMLILRVGAARVNVTSLPASFPGQNTNNNWQYDERRRYLLATASAGGNPVVLVADTCNISAWEQSKHTRIWKPRSQVVIENETIKDDLAKLVEGERPWGNRKHVPQLLWFGERSGAVLLGIHGNDHLLWLDLHSKKIVRCFSDPRLSFAKVYCPYEVDLSSWVPTFSSAITL